MYPPIFTVCRAAPAVTALIGSSPCRLYPFGRAPQNIAPPYALWRQISGSPENYLSGSPDVDQYSIQIDVYGATGASARAVATALRDAIEPHAHIIRWSGEGRDPETNEYTLSFDVDWYVNR